MTEVVGKAIFARFGKQVQITNVQLSGGYRDEDVGGAPIVRDE